ncbi:MAG: ATP-binding protein [Sedimenticola sp.]
MQASDIMIHIDENLMGSEQQELETTVRELEGVIAPRFNKEHLFLVSYNPDKINSSELLSTVKASGYKAQLVGM